MPSTGLAQRRYFLESELCSCGKWSFAKSQMNGKRYIRGFGAQGGKLQKPRLQTFRCHCNCIFFFSLHAFTSSSIFRLHLCLWHLLPSLPISDKRFFTAKWKALSHFSRTANAHFISGLKAPAVGLYLPKPARAFDWRTGRSQTVNSDLVLAAG